MAIRQKGIFCLEGIWQGNLKCEPSVEPLLDLLDQMATPMRKHVHRDVGTVEEFEFYVKSWSQHRYQTHPVLYLAFHGVAGGLCVGDQRKTCGIVSLEKIARWLDGRARRRVIHFGSCSTLAVHGNSLHGFLTKTGALAVCGYRKDIPWTDSAAVDLILFQAIQDQARTSRGMQKAKEKVLTNLGGLAKHLAFHMSVNNRA
jgi:hypothetical protein